MTNVASASATYAVSVSAPPGVDVLVSPPTLALDPGAAGTFTVELTAVTAPLGQYTSGSLTWSDGVHEVRSPLVARPVAPPAPG